MPVKEKRAHETDYYEFDDNIYDIAVYLSDYYAVAMNAKHAAHRRTFSQCHNPFRCVEVIQLGRWRKRRTPPPPHPSCFVPSRSLPFGPSTWTTSTTPIGLVRWLESSPEKIYCLSTWRNGWRKSRGRASGTRPCCDGRRHLEDTTAEICEPLS